MFSKCGHPLLHVLDIFLMGYKYSKCVNTIGDERFRRIQGWSCAGRTRCREGRGEQEMRRPRSLGCWTRAGSKGRPSANIPGIELSKVAGTKACSIFLYGGLRSVDFILYLGGEGPCCAFFCTDLPSRGSVVECVLAMPW